MSKVSDPAEWFGEAEFEFEGQSYKLTFDNVALLEAEGALGESMLDWLPQLYETIKAGRNPMMKHLAALVYGGLKQNHDTISQRDTVKMVMAEDPGLRDAIKRALAAIEIPVDALADVGNAAPAGNRRQRRAAKKAK